VVRYYGDRDDHRYYYSDRDRDHDRRDLDRDRHDRGEHRGWDHDRR
jgi:hypothetical protein